MGPKPSLKRPGKEGKKRVRLPPMKENETPSNAGKQKESSVLKDSSLAVLSRELGPEKYNGLVLGMLLNIPTITLVRIANDASECGLKDASDKTKIDATQTILFKWRELRAGTKEREKVKELTRAIKEMGKDACAQMIAEKNIENVELTADAFAALA